MDYKQTNVEYGKVIIEASTSELVVTLSKQLSSNFVVTFNIESSEYARVTLQTTSTSFIITGDTGDIPVGTLHYNVVYL